MENDGLVGGGTGGSPGRGDYLGGLSRQARQPAAVCLLTQMDTHCCCCDWRRPKHMAAFVSEVPASVRLTGVAVAMDLIAEDAPEGLFHKWFLQPEACQPWHHAESCTGTVYATGCDP